MKQRRVILTPAESLVHDAAVEVAEAMLALEPLLNTGRRKDRYEVTEAMERVKQSVAGYSLATAVLSKGRGRKMRQRVTEEAIGR
jgi:ABC-type uncharacterized transport system substrate-binding protein